MVFALALRAMNDAASFALRVIGSATAAWLITIFAALTLKRSPASLRHLVWMMGTLAALFMPLLVATLPSIGIGPAESESRAIATAAPDVMRPSVEPALEARADRPAAASETLSKPSAPITPIANTTAPTLPATRLNLRLPALGTMLAIYWLAVTVWLLIRQSISHAQVARIDRRATAIACETAAETLRAQRN